MQTQTITRPTANHTAPTFPRSAVSFAPRPCLTRGVAEIWAALTPAQRAEVDAIGRCVSDILAQNPLAARPDCGAITIWLCERLGVVWNFTVGVWEWETDTNK
jgi:hypothetical protein